jgi:hypothetical protein
VAALLRFIEQGALTARVGEVRVLDVGEGREGVLLGFGRADDFENANAANEERVRDEGAMAAPRNGFGAHERGRVLGGEIDGVGEGGSEIGRLHVVGVAPETVVAPAEIDGVFAWMAEAAEFFHVDVADFSGAQRGSERVGVELRIAAGFRKGADIDQLPDAILLQQGDEFVDGARGMADREDRQRLLGTRFSHERIIVGARRI